MRLASRVLALALSLSALVGCDSPRPDPASPVSRQRVSTVERAREVGAVAPLELVKHEAPEVVPIPLDPSVRMPTDWHADRSWSGATRVAHAKNTKQAPVKALFGAAGVVFPAKELLFRVYKKEAQVEVWAGSGAERMARVATYGICAASGELGPKRAEGDMQVPEGFYTLSYFHPESQYYLAALVDYPNLSDRIRGTKTPGGQILMHGSCASIGCISMTDERMEELYLMAWSTWRESGARTHVHVFPSRDIDGLLADASLHEHHAFWRELDAGKRAFESAGHIPEIAIERDGRYVVAD